MTKLAQQQHHVWEGLHNCPLGLARVLGLSSVLIIIGLAALAKFRGVPYYDLPLSITRLRAIMQFRLGSHGLPIEQGRFVRPRLPRHLRRCTLCRTLSVGDERHYLFECPELHMARAQSSSLFHDAQGSMRSLVWHKRSAAVSQFLAAVLHRIETLNTIPSS